MSVRLREVQPKDWQFILQMRNQEEVRLSCHDTSIISMEDHLRYMEKISSDPNCHQWIIIYDDEDIGHAKIVHDEFGYMIKDGFRGKGIGTKMYDLIFEKAKKLGIKKLYGTIKVDRPVPMKVALKVGFAQTGIIQKDGKPYAYQLERIIE